MSKLYQRKNLVKASVFIFMAKVASGNVFAADVPALRNLFEAIYQILLPVSIILALFLIVINGYGILTSEGDPRKVQSARENLTAAILGLVFVLAALAIYRVIVSGLLNEPAPF